jgi:uncharacterized protein YfaS (alpha-2-macroglobulin family)
VTFTDTGPAIEPSSAGLSVSRTWNRLVSESGPDGPMERAVPFTESVPTGTLVEAEVVVETAEPREFVIVSSPYPAGFEPEKRWTPEARGREASFRADHVEDRDDRTVFFAKSLPAGRTVFRRTLRATHVGSFTALPAQASSMYFPDLAGNSKGETIEVSTAAEAGTPPTEDGK